jgi:replication factor C subunit 1
MFTTKYKPNNIQEFVGNKDAILTFIRWLLNWDSSKNDTKCALFSGKNGIGKSLLVELLLKRHDYNIINLSIDEDINREYISQTIKPLLKMKKTFNDQENCLVISDIDGSADYGFISLIQECIKESEIPIICICDDRYDLGIKPILPFCVDIKLISPKYDEVYPLLYKIIMEERIKITKKELLKVYEESNGDIRYMLNTLQLFIKKKDMHKDIQNTNIFEIANKLLSLDTSFEDKVRYFKMAEDISLLMIQENYIPATIPLNNEYQRMDNIAYEADALSDADFLASTYNFELNPYVISNSIKAASKCTNKNRQIKFPQFLGRTSVINKNKREIVNYDSFNDLLPTVKKESKSKKVKELKVKNVKEPKVKKVKEEKPKKEPNVKKEPKVKKVKIEC